MKTYYIKTNQNSDSQSLYGCCYLDTILHIPPVLTFQNKLVKIMKLNLASVEYKSLSKLDLEHAGYTIFFVVASFIN